MGSAATQFYSGTSGLVLPIPKSSYPPEFREKSRLAYYASLTNSLEINSSFYKIPKITTIVRWTESAPASFRFTFKLPKTITHAKQLNFNREDIDQFIRIIASVGNKKGCLLVQFPPGLNIQNADGLEKLLNCISKANNDNSWKIAIELRNKSWYNQAIYDLLNEHKAAMVIHDLPAATTPVTESSASFRYLRFHGPGGRYRGSYPNDFLHQYAQSIKLWISEGTTVYCYFNNTMGDAFRNLQTLNDFVRS
jgi:uncharacterized protein YecE (DUF72 family)